jgi:hypothetical protein
MARRYRTLIAFLVAPAMAPAIYSIIAATTRPPGEGPTWQGSFGQWFVLVGVVSYGISYLIGIPVFFCLRRIRRETMLAYSVIGGIVGFLYLPIINGFIGLTPELVAISFFFALLGSTVGASFKLIAGRALVSNQSPDPALASVTHPAGQGARHP